MQKTSIEWTNWSANPLKMEMPDGTRINACMKISPGCRSCYAEAIVRRWWKKEWGEFPGYIAALLKIGKPVLIEKELHDVLRLESRIASGKADPDENRVFWNDMTDEFLDFWPDDFRDKLFAVRALTPNLIHQVLTKRANRSKQYLTTPDRHNSIELAADALLPGKGHPSFGGKHMLPALPFPGVHLGVSVENKQHGLPRIEHLLRTPAAVRFLSIEPLLEDLGTLHSEKCQKTGDDDLCPIYLRLLDWVIVGGESGFGARPMHPDWVRSIRDQCVAAGVSFFFKQWGEWMPVMDNVDRHYPNGRPGFGDTNREYNLALRKMIRAHGGTKLVDDRPEGWRPCDIERGMCINGGNDDKFFMVNVGKKAAGRLLDGREWNEMPQVKASVPK